MIILSTINKRIEQKVVNICLFLDLLISLDNRGRNDGPERVLLVITASNEIQKKAQATKS